MREITDHDVSNKTSKKGIGEVCVKREAGFGSGYRPSQTIIVLGSTVIIALILSVTLKVFSAWAILSRC